MQQFRGKFKLRKLQQQFVRVPQTVKACNVRKTIRQDLRKERLIVRPIEVLARLILNHSERGSYPLSATSCRIKRPIDPMTDIRRGLIIVNTGPGKGKTTAAMGTALRAVGQGMRVLMLQFLKGSWHYGELDAVQAFGDKFVMKQMGRGFVKVGTEKPDPEDVRMVEEAWAEGEKAIQSGEWDLVVLDEINYAISYGMLDPATVVDSLKKKPEMVHVILTGRNAHPTIVEAADTVTEMRQVKHAYEKGVMAQRGIEY
jgi:cob(I)alamin adenosyltransferase